MTLTQSEFDTAAIGRQADATSRSQILETFDRNASATRAALSGKSDAEFMAPWALKNGSQTIFSMPRAVVWRSFVLSHLVHHRGQMSVYLRLLDLPVPSIYGPSADEGSLSRRSATRLSAAGGLLFAILATANASGCRYGVSDQAFYIPVIIRALLIHRRFHVMRR